jgi:hypothetical protein
MTPTITPEQRRAIDEHHGQPVFVFDTDRSETFVLLSGADYDRVRDLLGPANDNGDWTDEKDERRCELIDKDIAGAITPQERTELAELERQANDYYDRIAAPPMEGARRLHRELLNRRAQQP